jgi:hypothetical protein
VKRRGFIQRLGIGAAAVKALTQGVVSAKSPSAPIRPVEHKIGDGASASQAFGSYSFSISFSHEPEDEDCA